MEKKALNLSDVEATRRIVQFFALTRILHWILRGIGVRTGRPSMFVWSDVELRLTRPSLSLVGRFFRLRQRHFEVFRIQRAFYKTGQGCGPLPFCSCSTTNTCNDSNPPLIRHTFCHDTPNDFNTTANLIFFHFAPTLDSI